MNPFLTLLPYGISLQLVVICLVVLWQRKGVFGATTFSWVLFMELVWILGLICESLGLSLEEKIFWDNVQFFPYLFIPFLFLKFAQDMSQKPLHKFLSRGLLTFSLIFSILPWFDPWLGFLMRSDSHLISRFPFSVLEYGFTPMMYLSVLYSYILTLWAMVTLIHQLIHQPQPRSSLVAILLGIATPMLGGLLTLADVTVLYQRDLSPISFGIGALFVSWGLFRKNLFKLLPVAKNLIFQSLETPLCIISEKGTILDLNDSFHNLPGFKEKNLIKGSHLEPLFPQWKQWTEKQETSEYASKNRTWEVTTTALRLNNSLLGWILSFHEVTRLTEQLNQSTKALEENKRTMDLTLQLTGATLFENDLIEGTSIATPGLYEYLGYNLTEIPSLMRNFPIHPEDLPLVMSALEKHIQGELPLYSAEFRIKDKAGNWHWTSGRGKIVEWTPQGQAKKLVGLSVSIHKEKTAALELDEKNKELEQFTYSVSHDLKSPLITIRSYLGSVLQDLEDKRYERAVADVHRIDRAAQKMDGLLSSVLEISRIGRTTGPITLFSLSQLVPEVIEMLKTSLDSVKAQVHVSPSLPILRGNKVKFTQLLQNLLENSVKFHHPERPLQINISWNQERNLLTVEDNGLGIAPEYKDKVFGLFEKIDPHSPGYGLGLAIVSRVAALFKSRVFIEETPGGGCRIQIELNQEALAN